MRRILQGPNHGSKLAHLYGRPGQLRIGIRMFEYFKQGNAVLKGKGARSFYASVADSPGWNVQDAEKTEFVIWIGNHTQV